MGYLGLGLVIFNPGNNSSGFNIPRRKIDGISESTQLIHNYALPLAYFYLYKHMYVQANISFVVSMNFSLKMHSALHNRRRKVNKCDKILELICYRYIHT
jgi:hypothetical protein